MAHELDLDQIELRRKAKGLTVVQLAKAAGLPERTVRYALSGRPSSDGTLHALLDHHTENPLLRNVSADEMLAQDVAGLAKMEREAERRQVVVKADETPGQAQLREALGHYSEPHQTVLLDKAEQLDQMATTIAKETGATREDVVAQLLAAQPELLEPYDQLERRRLIAKMEADAQASARLYEAQERGAEEGRVELEKAAPKPSVIDVKPSGAQDITDLSTDDTGAQDAVAEARAAMIWSQREGKLFDTMIELIRAFRKAGSPAAPPRAEPVRKQEEPVNGVDADTGRLRVSQALQYRGGPSTGAPVLVETKSEKSRRTLDLPAILVEALRRHRVRQSEERLAAGWHWHEEWNLVFCTERGEPLKPWRVLRDFKLILARAGLPVIRFHDLRHSAASLLLLHGVDVRTVADILGHSSTHLTQNTYQHVLPALREQAVKAQEAYLGG